MKATGIVRRIDDLGRVVVPKEIRRTLRIREGDPLEIFTDKDGEIILKKYSPMGEISSVVKELCQAVAKTSRRSIAVCDRDSVIAVAGGKGKKLTDAEISRELKYLMEARKRYDARKRPERFSVSDLEESQVSLAYPIISAGDVTGCVVFLEEDERKEVTEPEAQMADMLVGFLGGQLES